MGYAEECERWAGEGFSGPEAARIAGSGVHPRYDEDEEQEPEDDDESEEE